MLETYICGMLQREPEGTKFYVPHMLTVQVNLKYCDFKVFRVFYLPRQIAIFNENLG